MTVCSSYIGIRATLRARWLAEVSSCSKSCIYVDGPFHPVKDSDRDSQDSYSVLQRRKLRLREMKRFMRTHLTGKMQSQVRLSSNPSFCPTSLLFPEDRSGL